MKKINKKWLPYEDAHEIVLKEAVKYKINSYNKWMDFYVKSNKMIKGIPKAPYWVYRNDGWVSWGKWLGTNNKVGINKKYTVNEDFFKVWSRDMAYILGFWWADGCIREKTNKKNGYGFIIGQHTKDIYILQLILDCMESNHPICTRKNRQAESFFEIRSETIFKDVVELGGIPRKSLISKFPCVPKKYFSDFIRGLFDGDGSISVNKSYMAGCYFCSGNLCFLKDLNKNLCDYYCINGKIASDKNKKSVVSCYRLYFGIHDIVRLGKIMYNTNSSLVLIRKKDKFNIVTEYRSKKYGI